MPNKRMLYQQVINEAKKAKEEHDKEKFIKCLLAFLPELDKVRHELYKIRVKIKQTSAIQNKDRRTHVMRKLLELERNCSRKYDNLIYHEFKLVISHMRHAIEEQLDCRPFGILEQLITALESEERYADLCCTISRMF